MRAATVQGGTDQSSGGQSKIDSRGSTLLLSGEDIVSIVVKRFPMQLAAQRPKGLATDSAISGRAGAGGSGNQLGMERKLQEVGEAGGGTGLSIGGRNVGRRLSWVSAF